MAYSSNKTGGQSTTLVLCGGRGERMGDAFRDRQKVLLDIGGASLLEQVVRGTVRGVGSIALQRNVALLTGHGAKDVEREVESWPAWLSDKVAAVKEYRPGKDSLADIVSQLPSPKTMVSGNILLDYPAVLTQVDGMLRDDPQTPIVVSSPTLRTSTHYAVETDGDRVIGLPRRAATPAAREVVDVFGLTDDVIDIADEMGLGCASAIARRVGYLKPKHIEYSGNWAHFETPQDFTNYMEGQYGHFDFS